MKVKTIRSTEEPERLVCRAARGDYYDGFVGDADYDELMETVDTKHRHRKYVLETLGGGEVEFDDQVPDIRDMHYRYATEARTLAFIEKELKRGHYGIFEHPQITIAVEGLSRSAMAQATRHRHMTFDVQSMRYVDFSDKEAIIPKSLRDSTHFSRETGNVDLTNLQQTCLREDYEEKVKDMFETYQHMNDRGIPKEDSRFILPIGSPVNMTFSANLRSMMHFLNLRQRADAQWEVRELANKICDELEDWAPYTTKWWNENGPVKIGP